MDKKDTSQIEQGKARKISTQRVKIVKNKNIHDQLQYMSDLLDHVSDAIVASDAEYRLTFWNAAAESMYGWKADEVLGTNGIDVVQTIFPEANKALMLKSINATGKYRGEATQTCKNGTRFPVEVSSIALRNKQGQVTGYVSVNRDITGRKQLEEKLYESNERLQWAMEASLDGLWDWDLPTNNVYYSPAYFAMLGYPSDGKLPAYVNTWTELIHPDDRQKALNANIDCIQNRCERFEVEFRMLAQDGIWKWILGKGKAVRRDAQGKALRMVGTHTDITERKQMEEALQESEEKHRTFIEQSTEGVTLVDEQGNIIEWNYAREVVTGLKREDVLGKPYWDMRFNLLSLDRQTPDVLQRYKSTTLAMLQTGQSPIFNKVHEGELVTVTGELKTIEQNAFSIKTKHGFRIGSVMRDISERKRTEQELLKSETKTKENNILLRSIMESPQDIVIFALDVNFCYTLFTVAHKNTMKAIWGVDIEIGMNMLDAIGDPLDREKARKNFERVMRGEYQTLIEEYGDPGKLRTFYEDRYSPISDETGAVLGLTVFVTDITERKQAELRIQNQLEQLNALRNIDKAIKSTVDLRTTLRIFLNEATAQLNVDAAAIFLFNNLTSTLDHAASCGFNSAALQDIQLGFGEGYAGRVLFERKTIYIPDLIKAENKPAEVLALAGEKFSVYVGSPLIAKGQVVGVLEIFQRSPLAPDPEWLNFLEILAGQAAIAIDSAQLFENLQRSNFDLTLAYGATIEGWSHAMELRDHETEGHTQRVTSLTLKLAWQMGIPDVEMIHIRRGALLHDIGKMGIPDSILLKPGNLTEDEWKIMHQHTTYAYEMLHPIQYLRPALDIPQYHHEKWDGTGYPHKLKGEDIPLAARIFAIVDVWDAVTNDRSYRSGWSKEKAIEYIKSQSGKHFDPKVVETFLILILNE